MDGRGKKQAQGQAQERRLCRWNVVIYRDTAFNHLQGKCSAVQHYQHRKPVIYLSLCHAGGVHKRAGAGIAANHKLLAPLQNKAAQMLQHSEPAEAERIDPSAVEPVDASLEVSQCDPEEDLFPVEELHSPPKEPTAQWQPYKKPKDIKSLDLDTILIPQPEKFQSSNKVRRTSQN